jgi:hypothetical protein
VALSPVFHVAIIDAAIAAIPARWRRNLLVTIDGAGSSHAVIEYLTALNNRPGWSVAYSVGIDLDERARTAIGHTPEDVWSPALDPVGDPREDAQVAELTGLLRESAGGDRLDGWPTDMRILVRREKIEHGTQLSLFEQLNGYRYQVTATATRGGQPQRLEARHRVHARVEGFIRNGKATGLARWPSASFAINTAWVTAAARLVYHSLILRIPETWPWAQEFADAFNRVLAIPRRTGRCRDDPKVRSEPPTGTVEPGATVRHAAPRSTRRHEIKINMAGQQPSRSNPA